MLPYSHPGERKGGDWISRDAKYCVFTENANAPSPACQQREEGHFILFREMCYAYKLFMVWYMESSEVIRGACWISRNYAKN